MGRPSEFSQAVADEICEQLIEGFSLRRICKRPGMPHASTVCRWLADEARADFREQYTRAREAQADTLADETIFIADTPKLGVTTNTKMVMVKVVDEETGEEREVPVTETRTKRGDMLGHRRLQVETRKWFASKLRPKKYGERLELDGGLVLKHVSAAPLSEEEWEKRHGGST